MGAPDILIWRSAIRRAARVNLSSKGDSANGVCAALTASYTLRFMCKNFGSPKRASKFLKSRVTILTEG